MSFILRAHPVQTLKQQSAVIFLSLLRSYVELNTVYLLDQPFTNGRVRLTNTLTGEYVIYGDHSPLSTPHDIGIDEQLFMNIPRGYLRVRTAPGAFEFIDVSQNIEYLGAATSMWGMRVDRISGKLVCVMTVPPASVLVTIRQEQFKRLSMEIESIESIAHT